MMKLLRSVVWVLVPALVVGIAGQVRADESLQAKIARAMSAAPASISANATIMDMDAKGKTQVLRKGTNGFTCFPGHLSVIGDDPICADAPSMQWAGDLMAHKPRPTTTQPGVAYMLAGGRDFSATDPWATKSAHPFTWGPHWMIMWPFNAKTSGLSTAPSNTGTWIMWAGTPYAHLMINQKP
jgi:hypothetical protein